MGNWDVSKPHKDGEPCEDCISRQAAIDAIRNDVMGGLNYEGILKRLPSVTPKQSGWHYTDLPPSDDPYKRYLVVYSPYDRNYGRNTAPRFEIADYYKGDGLYNDKPWHLTISHSVMEKEILAWKDIGIVDEVMQGAKMVEQQENCDTCKHKDDGWDSEHCDGCCGNHSGFEPQESEEHI